MMSNYDSETTSKVGLKPLVFLIITLTIWIAVVLAFYSSPFFGLMVEWIAWVTP